MIYFGFTQITVGSIRDILLGAHFLTLYPRYLVKLNLLALVTTSFLAT
jgi:uncharacterized membrane protein YeiH